MSGWVVWWLGGCSPQPEPVPGYGEVATAVRYIAPGAVLGASDVFWVRLPDDYVPSKAVDRFTPFVGARVLEPLLPGETLRTERLKGGVPLLPTERMRGKFGPHDPAEDTVMVIIAARDVAPGHVLTEDDLYAIEIAPRYLPNHVYLSPEYVVGRSVCSLTLANELIRSERLYDPAVSASGCEALP